MCIYDCMWNPTVRLLINRFLSSYLILYSKIGLIIDPYSLLILFLCNFVKQHFTSWSFCLEGLLLCTLLSYNNNIIIIRIILAGMAYDFILSCVDVI